MRNKRLRLLNIGNNLDREAMKTITAGGSGGTALENLPRNKDLQRINGRSRENELLT